MSTENVWINVFPVYNETEDVATAVVQGLKAQLPGFKATLFVLPGLTDIATIVRLKALGQQLAPMGWFGPRGECLAWDHNTSLGYITTARDMGIDAPLFMPPGMFVDGDVLTAAGELGYTVIGHSKLAPPNAPNMLFVDVQDVPHRPAQILLQSRKMVDDIDTIIERAGLQGATCVLPQDLIETN